MNCSLTLVLRRMASAAVVAYGFLFITGCSEKAECAKSADLNVALEQLQQALSARNITIGCNEKRSSIVGVGACACVVDSPELMTEAARQKLFHDAFGKALVNIARCEQEIGAGAHAAMTDEIRGDVSSIDGVTKVTLLGLKIVALEELYEKAGSVYQIALAIEKSSRSRIIALNALGEEKRSIPFKGSKSIQEKLDAVDYDAVLGGELFIDSAGDVWLIGTVTEDETSRAWYQRWLKHSSEASYYYGISRRAMREDLSREIFALYSAARMVRDVVTIRPNDETCRAEGLELSGDRRIDAVIYLNADDTRIKWVERSARNHISGKNIKVLVAAIKCKDLKTEAMRPVNK